MLRKKIGMTTNTLIAMALGLAIFIVMFLMIKDGSLSALWHGTTELVDPAKVDLCMKSQEFYNKEKKDCDDDGTYDVCDFCLGGDNTKDTDRDGTPDDCDEAPSNSKNKKCADAKNNLIKLGNYEYCLSSQVAGCDQAKTDLKSAAGK